MVIKCHSCQEVFKDYHSLALHISVSKKGHRKGRKWAAKFLAGKPNRPEIKRVVDNPDHENTEYGDENRANAVRHISGENEYTNTHCPNCNKGSRQLLPIEYVQSNMAWRNKRGVLMVACQLCSERNSNHHK